MQNITDKLSRATQFRARLSQAMKDGDMSQSALARETGVDRSTISQLLTGDGARLPNAHVVGACAAALGVSADWLLSLSDRPESAARMLAESLTLTDAPRALIDEQIFAWHREAAGYKIRYVPATLPDMLKTDAILNWEYTPQLGRTPAQAINASRDWLDWIRNSSSDYEVAVPMHEMSSFARGNGYYAGLDAQSRHEQIDRMLTLSRDLYPRLRLYLYDARRLYSAPITVFGPLLAAIYIGRKYLAFRDSARVQTFAAHFDHLVREADVSARALPAWLAELKGTIQ